MLKLLVLVLFVTACKHPDLVFNNDAGGDDDADDGGTQTKCAARGLPPTTITGTVFAPNGTLPLHGVDVYVPVTEPDPIPFGAQCARCADPLPGGAVVRAVSNDKGEFVLSNAPDGPSVPLFIQIGKWRRRVSVPVTECTTNVLSAAQTSLPKKRSEGNLPRMAFVTGACDQLECVMRKLGIDDSEFTGAGAGSINLYTSMGAATMLADGTVLTNATELWSDLDRMKNYDAMFLGCECSQLETQKTQQMFNNIQAYADLGGRVYATHYQSVWIDGKAGGGGAAAPSAEWQSVLSCPMDGSGFAATTIDQINNPKGVSFANWLVHVGASQIKGSIDIAQQARQTCDSVNLTIADQWMYQTASQKPQMVQFTTPLSAAKAQRCGKVTFSDMHSSDTTSGPFPTGCDSGPLTPQQKALAFVVFELTACTGPRP